MNIVEESLLATRQGEGLAEGQLWPPRGGPSGPARGEDEVQAQGPVWAGPGPQSETLHPRHAQPGAARLDTLLPPRRNEALRRRARGVDAPPTAVHPLAPVETRPLP